VLEAETIDYRTRPEETGITEKKIKEKAKNLRPRFAVGSERIGPSLLQNLQEEVVPALRIIFRRSMAEGEVPED
jgi:hypothetical protein